MLQKLLIIMMIVLSPLASSTPSVDESSSSSTPPSAIWVNDSFAYADSEAIDQKWDIEGIKTYLCNRGLCSIDIPFGTKTGLYSMIREPRRTLTSDKYDIHVFDKDTAVQSGNLLMVQRNTMREGYMLRLDNQLRTVTLDDTTNGLWSPFLTTNGTDNGFTYWVNQAAIIDKFVKLKLKFENKLEYELTMSPADVQVENVTATVENNMLVLTLLRPSNWPEEMRIDDVSEVGQESYAGTVSGTTSIVKIPMSSITVWPYVGKIHLVEGGLAAPVKKSGFGTALYLAVDNPTKPVTESDAPLSVSQNGSSSSSNAGWIAGGIMAGLAVIMGLSASGVLSHH